MTVAITSAQTMKDHELIWRIWGILPKPTDGPWYMTYSILLHTGAWIFIACILLSMIVAESIADIIEVVALATTFILIYIKAICLRWNFKKVYAVFGIMRQLEERTNRSAAEQNCLRIAQKQSRLSRDAIAVFCFLGLPLFMIQPLANGHKLMYPSLYPFDWDRSRTLYYSTFFLQVFFNAFIVLLLPTVDTYGPALYSFLAAYVDILRHRLENLASSSPKARIRENNLRDCVKYHITILKLSQQIEEVFRVHCLLQMCSSSLLVCSTAFQFSVISPTETPVAFAFLFEYLAAVVYQLYIPCYYSSLVINRSAELATSMYFCDWTGESQRFTRMMLILMARAKLPIVMKVYKNFFNITLQVFVSVMRFAYSMLTFLKSMQ